MTSRTLKKNKNATIISLQAKCTACKKGFEFRETRKKCKICLRYYYVINTFLHEEAFIIIAFLFCHYYYLQSCGMPDVLGKWKDMQHHCC